jgi:hypothetical protein
MDLSTGMSTLSTILAVVLGLAFIAAAVPNARSAPVRVAAT